MLWVIYLEGKVEVEGREEVDTNLINLKFIFFKLFKNKFNYLFLKKLNYKNFLSFHPLDYYQHLITTVLMTSEEGAAD